MTDWTNQFDQLRDAVNADSSSLATQVIQLTSDVQRLTAQAASTTSPSGLPMPSTDPAGWSRVWSKDDFTDLSDITAYPTGWVDTSNAGHYQGKALTTAGASLLNIRLATIGGVPCSTALTPNSGKGQLYGRYAVRAKMTANGPGYKTAWLLWPDDNVWPAHGEVDWPEGAIPGTPSAFVHYANATGGDAKDAGYQKVRNDDWHTYVTEWEPTIVRAYVDGVLVMSSTHSPKTPMHWVWQCEVDTTPRAGIKPPATTVADIAIDWAVMWSKA